jgi:hypothetical protein
MSTPKVPALRQIARILESDARLAAWAERHRREAALTLLLRQHLPRPIAERVRVVDARSAVLELAASAGAIAAALRQRVPGLRAALAQSGCDFTEIRVRVQVVLPMDPRPKNARRPWDGADAAPLFDLARRLPEGPLRVSIARWSRRAQGR